MDAREKFLQECGYAVCYYGDPLTGNGTDIPCYGLRISVADGVDTPDLIKKLIKWGVKAAGAGETMFFFSVTKQDACWQAWDEFHKDNPDVFSAVVETKSRHKPTYPVRLYIYLKKPRAIKVK